MKPFIETITGKDHPPQHVKFVELMFDIKSELNKEKSFEDKLDQACKICNLDKQTILQDCQELIHYYLSFYQYNNKYQLLIGKQVMYWNIQKEALNEIGEDVTKDLTKMDKLADLSDKLFASIEKLYQEIYGEQTIIGIAKEEVKKAWSPEMRLRKKQEIKIMPHNEAKDRILNTTK